MWIIDRIKCYFGQHPNSRYVSNFMGERWFKCNVCALLFSISEEDYQSLASKANVHGQGEGAPHDSEQSDEATPEPTKVKE